MVLEKALEKENWLKAGDDFCQQGDFSSMRAAGREILELNDNDGDGLAMIAEASLYLSAATGDKLELARAMEKLLKAEELHPDNLRTKLVRGLAHWHEFALDKAIPAFEALLSHMDEAGNHVLGDSFHRVMEKGCAFYADACLLAAMPEKAARAAFMAAGLVEDKDKKASYHSKGLFLSNYRSLSASRMLELHQDFSRLLRAKMVFPHNVEKRRREHTLRVGYISPDFRMHAAAYFFTPFLRDYNKGKFKVYAYSTGKSDHVTARFRKMPEVWRDMRDKTPQLIAHQIFDDRIDILVDLSGHSQNSCLPVLAYKPAPVQLSAIGYINTTGLQEVDYFLSDEVCLPATDPGTSFTESTIRLPGCHLCYVPEVMHNIKSEGHDAPVKKNGYVTFGSFNNFAKVSREVLFLWRSILDMVPDSKLVIKSKICSIISGREIVKKRFAEVGADVDRLELRPYSPDYLQQYADIDIALDTFPYNGGLTTCDALYMGVPVVALNGKTHGSRFGASILKSAGLDNLVAATELDYVNKAVALARNAELLNMLHQELPLAVRQSPLMNSKAYMDMVEETYSGIWARYCQGNE